MNSMAVIMVLSQNNQIHHFSGQHLLGPLVCVLVLIVVVVSLSTSTVLVSWVGIFNF